MQSEPTTCQCGSGLFADWLYDGHGIPLVKACERCADEKLKGFRPDIMEQYVPDEQLEEG